MEWQRSAYWSNGFQSIVKNACRNYTVYIICLDKLLVYAVIYSIGLITHLQWLIPTNTMLLLLCWSCLIRGRQCFSSVWKVFVLMPEWILCLQDSQGANGEVAGGSESCTFKLGGCIMLLICFKILMMFIEGNRLMLLLLCSSYCMYITYFCKLRIMFCVAGAISSWM